MTDECQNEDPAMHAPDPALGELIIAAARIRLDQQTRHIPAPAFKFYGTPNAETAAAIRELTEFKPWPIADKPWNGQPWKYGAGEDEWGPYTDIKE